MAHRDDSAAARSSSHTPALTNAATLADGRRVALRRQARRIRRSVALFTAALFCAAFLMVYVQLASGHDPALTADARRASTQLTASKSVSRTQSSTSGASGSSASTEAGTSETASAVTTSQS